jgi:hypothetical protein
VVWEYDFRDYNLIDEVSILTAVRTVQYSSLAWTITLEEMPQINSFIAMIVEGDPYHMVFVLSGKSKIVEIVRKWPLMRYQDQESTKTISFLPRFASSQVLF